MNSTAADDLPDLESVQNASGQYILNTYATFPLCLTRGKGAWISDMEGRQYLDFGAGIAVASIGHAPDRLVEAVSKQAATLIHTSNLYHTLPQVRLAQKLVEAVELPGKIFFSNSGAESNELAYKIAQRFALRAGEKDEIITFNNSFHGRTLGGLSATAQGKIKDGFGPLVPGFRHLPFNDVQALKDAVNPRTSALLLEPIQGESGINPASVEFLETAQALCREHNALLMLDEVQCGLGRTGDYCAWRSLGAVLEPDVITWAKGLAGGMPLGAVWISNAKRRVGREEMPLCDIITPGSHGTTYGGGPVPCAAALAVFEEIEENHLLQNVKDRGAELLEALTELQENSPVLHQVRGQGLMIGLQFAEDFWEHVPERLAAPEARQGPPSKWLVLELRKMGLLVIPAGTHVLRLLPPLNAAPEEVRHALAILTDLMENLRK